MKKRNIAITLGVMCIALTTAVSVQYRTIRDANKVTGSNVNSELKTEVLRWKGRYEELYEDLDVLEKMLEEKRTLATSNDEASIKLQNELRTLNALIGTIDVSGEGVIINLADNSSVTNQTISIFDNISNYLIHDTDLIMLVNELKNAGAEAISINNERIISTTSITCDGTVILINGNKISSPFTIKAIGSPSLILGAIQRTGGLLEELYAYGLVSSVSQEENVTIYKYSGVIE